MDESNSLMTNLSSLDGESITAGEDSNSCDIRHFASISKINKENTDPDMEYKFRSKRKASHQHLNESQIQCYKRLSELLEKSKRYTTMLFNRIEEDDNSMIFKLKEDAAKKMVEAKKLIQEDKKKHEQVAALNNKMSENKEITKSVRKPLRPCKRKSEVTDQTVPDPKKGKRTSARLNSRVSNSQNSEDLSSNSSSLSSSQNNFYDQSSNIHDNDVKLNGAVDSSIINNKTGESNNDKLTNDDNVLTEKDIDKSNDNNENQYKQPVLVTGGTLRKYQLDGVSWLMKLYVNGVNGILADEMGLGKTIQCVSLIADLICISVRGPFLICGPLSTLFNWVNEFTKFAPEIPCILYYGSKEERLNMLSKINKSVHVPSQKADVKPVVITSYEVIMKDQRYLSRMNWNLLIVDEGHRIKNSQCRLIRELKNYNSPHRLLLTGTPLQNNLSELWTLLNFLIPDIFNSSGSFETWFDVNFLESVDNADEQIIEEEQKSNTLSKIHQILTPFMLRRLKSDVDIIIPPKKELLVIAPFAEPQKEMYRSIVNRTIAQLHGSNDKDSGEVLPELTDQSKLEGRFNSRPMRSSKKKVVNYKLAFHDGDEDANDDTSKEGSVKGNDDDEEDSLSAWANAVITCNEELGKSKNNKDNDKNLDMGPAMLKHDQSPSSACSTGFKKQPIQLRNMMSLLRRCCNHPYLIKYPRSSDGEEGEMVVDENLVESSGKLKLVDRMLKKLKEGGHRVLIFSQSTQLMNILEEYCSFRNYKYCRLDGTMRLSDRQIQIQKFNDDDIFIFMLSTRAGGLGINLTKADTVIIYDSDWNPQCDLQAQDRCHRIGQLNPVVVYRLVAARSIDQTIVERANAKRKMEKMIIHKGKFKSSWNESLSQTTNTNNTGKLIDLNELIQILKETDYEGVIKEDTEMSEEKLDSLLDRSDLKQVWNDRKSGVVRTYSQCKSEKEDEDGSEKIGTNSNGFFTVVEDVDEFSNIA